MGEKSINPSTNKINSQSSLTDKNVFVILVTVEFLSVTTPLKFIEKFINAIRCFYNNVQKTKTKNRLLN